MNQEKIGVFIAKCRKDKNLTQEQLAEKLGVSNKSISRWETGKTMPDYSILKDLCSILEIDVNEFLSGEKIKKEEIQEHTIENLDSILKEYYKMKKQKDILKAILIIVGVMILQWIIILAITLPILNYEYENRIHITTDINEYKNVIGIQAKDIYKDKWGISEEIFPKEVNNLNVQNFKMICDDFLDQQFLSYLVVNYNEEEYAREVERLNNYGIEDYIGYYGVTGFTNYKLLAMESDLYQGFVYAITDGKSKIIYVEMIYCNYCMDINYEEEIPKEYLPDGFDAKENNLYRLKMLKEGI